MEDLEKIRKENNALPEKGPEVANSPVTTNGTDNGWSKEKLLEYTKELQNVFNMIATDTEKKDDLRKDTYPGKLLRRLSDAADKGLSFSEALPVADREEINKRIGKDKSKLASFIGKLMSVYKSDEFGQYKSMMNMLGTKKNRAESQANRAIERLVENIDTDELAKTGKITANEEGSKADYNTSAKRLNKKEGTSELERATAGGNKLSAAVRNAANQYALLAERGLGEEVTKLLRAGKAATKTVDEWKDLISTPGARFKNYVIPASIRNGIMSMSIFTEDNPNGTVLHLNPADRKNFLEALQTVKDKPVIETVYTNPRNKSVDVGDEVNSAMAEKIKGRFDTMFATGNDEYVYTDPSIKTFVDTMTLGNGTTFKTERERDKKESKGASVRNDDNYFNHLANIIKNGSDSQLDEYLNDKPLTVSKISKDPDNIPDEFNPVYDEDQYIRDNFGTDSADKARKLYKDIIDMQGTLSPDTALDKGMYTPGVLKMLGNRFKKLREMNPNVPYIRDILKSGKIDDTLGKVHPDADRLKVILGNLLTRDYINKNQEPIDWKGFNTAVDSNISRLNEAIKSGDFSGVGDGMDKATAEEILGYLNEAKDFTLTHQDIADQVKGKHDISELQSLAEADPEALANAEDAVSKALDNLTEAEASNKERGDAEAVAYARKQLEEARSKLDYLKNTKVDIAARANETGKSYQEVLNDYVHPDWEEDDIDSIVARYDLTDKLKEKYGKNVLGNNSQKSDHLADLLDKFADVYPSLGLSGWKDKLANWTKPLTPTELYGPKSSYKLAKEAIPGLTPEVWSAMVNNKALFSTDLADKRRNTTYTGLSKTQAGAAHTMEAAKDKLAKELQMADYTGDKDFASKKAAELGKKLEDAGISYNKTDNLTNKFNTAADALKNIMKGIKLDEPGANNE